MKQALRLSILVIAILSLLGPVPSQALTLSAKKLNKSGIRTVGCPKFVMSLKTGLSTSILPKTSICVATTNFGKLRKHIKSSRLVIDGTDQPGVPFPDIENQEGDVQSRPFTVANYPAIISYSVEAVSYKSTFKMSVYNADSGRKLAEFVRGRGGISGEVAWNIPGRYYLKMNAYGVATEDETEQPAYSVSVSFMDRYENYEIAATDLQDAGVKTTRCPAGVLDTLTNKLFSVGSKFVCSQSSYERLEEAGMLAAPLNLGLSLFMARDLDVYGAGGGIGLPFRVSRPINMNYTVTDPSDGDGSLRMNLINLTTGRSAKELVDVEGTIQNTNTSLNDIGDFYIYTVTHPSDPEELGDIEWTYTTAGSP